MKNKIKFIDLFAGIGGFHLALNKVNGECLFASEWDKECQKIYEKNFHLKPFGDITKINEKEIPKHDVLCAGFPCQAFSISGKRQGFKDTRGTLFFDVARIIKHHQPKLILLENVKNFLTHDNGNTISVVKKTLEELNYNVFYKVLNSSNFGIPQKRERIYIVGFNKKLKINEFKFPSNQNIFVSLKDYLLPDNLTKELVLNRDDIQLKKDKKIQKDIFGNYPQKPIRLGQVNKGGQGERIYSTNGHAVSLTAYGGGIGSKTGLYLVNKKLRKLSPRECARITGFPDSFSLSENKNHSYRQFGNSVVVNVLDFILKEIMKTNFINR
jgi:DNA (cytosine-5)-methyltransferase 1